MTVDRKCLSHNEHCTKFFDNPSQSIYGFLVSEQVRIMEI